MDLWVFDNDGTLYDDRRVGEQFMRLLLGYYSERASLPVEAAARELGKLKEKWKTKFTVIALMKEYGFGFSEMVENTYLGVKLEECGLVTPDSAKREVLNLIRAPKIVFTNNPSVFARKVLSFTGLLDCFEDCIGMEELGFCLKPDQEAYRLLEDRHRGFDRIVFCDDSLQNLDTARRMGWFTVWCRPSEASVQSEGGGHQVINSFEELLKI